MKKLRFHSPLLQRNIAATFGQGRDIAPQIIVPGARGDAAPVLADEVSIQNFVEQDCGADGWTIQRGMLIAIRDNGDGTYKVLKRYAIDQFGKA